MTLDPNAVQSLLNVVRVADRVIMSNLDPAEVDTLCQMMAAMDAMHPEWRTWA